MSAALKYRVSTDRQYVQIIFQRYRGYELDIVYKIPTNTFVSNTGFTLCSSIGSRTESPADNSAFNSAMIWSTDIQFDLIPIKIINSDWFISFKNAVAEYNRKVKQDGRWY